MTIINISLSVYPSNIPNILTKQSSKILYGLEKNLVLT